MDNRVAVVWPAGVTVDDARACLGPLQHALRMADEMPWRRDRDDDDDGIGDGTSGDDGTGAGDVAAAHGGAGRAADAERARVAWLPQRIALGSSIKRFLWRATDGLGTAGSGGGSALLGPDGEWVTVVRADAADGDEPSQLACRVRHDRPLRAAPHRIALAVAAEATGDVPGTDGGADDDAGDAPRDADESWVWSDSLREGAVAVVEYHLEGVAARVQRFFDANAEVRFAPRSAADGGRAPAGGVVTCRQPSEDETQLLLRSDAVWALRAQLPPLRFHWGDVRLTLRRAVDAGTGGKAWDAAEVMAHRIATCTAVRSALRGKRVLEVGCGLGLPAFAAAHWASSVVFTDVAPEVLRAVARNARANRSWAGRAPQGVDESNRETDDEEALRAGYGRCMDHPDSAALRLDWNDYARCGLPEAGDEESERVAALPAAEVVLFTDICYDLSVVEPLAGTFAALLLRPGPARRVAFGVLPVARAGVDKLERALRRRGMVMVSEPVAAEDIVVGDASNPLGFRWRTIMPSAAVEQEPTFGSME